MQYTLADLLNIEHIQAGIEARHAEDAIERLTAGLVDTGHATPEFAGDVLDREAVYPTGLPTQPFAVAIPHADPDHVLKSAVAVGTLVSPVKFGQMGTDGSTTLDVSIIFLLAIKEKEKQVEMIQQLIGLIQTPKLLDALSKAKSPAEALALIHTILR